MSSIMGAQARSNAAGFITSKHALVTVVWCVAREVAANNIRVNICATSPSKKEIWATTEDRKSKTMGVDTTAMLNQMIPMGRHAELDEIARSLLFLASNQSSFPICSVFMLDGGFNA